MPANDFLNPDGTTTVTVTSDQPIQGTNRYGRPYIAYRVKTPNGAEQMYFPSARAVEELQRRHVRRGSVLEIRGSRQESREGLAVTRYEVVAIREGETPHASVPATSNPDDLRMLRCVALKAAAATRSTTGEPPDVLATANAYFDWLVRP
jgi:hypothetical protein